MATVIVSAVRTPFGRFGGALKDVPAVELGAWAIRAACARVALAPDERDHLILGHCVGGGVGQVPARQAALRAGLPVAVQAVSLNTACTSALNAVIWGDLLIQSRRARWVIAGGMENMSQSPYILPRARWGYRLGDGPLVDDLTASLTCPLGGKHMGDYANDAAKAYGITRAMQDEWALRSHRRYFAAQEAGFFRQEIVPATVKIGKTEIVLDTDEQPRADTTLEKLAALPPAFSPDGTVTAGNAPGLNDGATAIVLMDEADARALGLEPLAWIVGAAQVSDEPPRISTVPAATARKLLSERGLRPQDVDLWEINEAFAAVPLICIRELDIDPERVNVNGGAVAIGHPVGATGARILMTLAYEMRRRGAGLGVATLCGAGANGAAVLLATEPDTLGARPKARASANPRRRAAPKPAGALPPLRFALFDLDQTLYPMTSGLMDEVGRLIKQYMRERCGFAESEIVALRDRYFREYGTTLRGLMLHHNVDPEDYLAYVHNLPLEQFIAPNPALDEALAALPLTKVIFTNASEAHARRVLALLGVERHFSAIIDIKAIRYVNKPEPGAYEQALALLGARPEECLLLDDAPRNLVPGRAMGMVTVLVGSEDAQGADFAIARIEDLPRITALFNGRLPRPEGQNAEESRPAADEILRSDQNDDAARRRP